MSEAQMFEVYTDWVGEGDCTRSEAAREFNVHKTTAQYHLDLAVANGLLKRTYTWTTKNQTGWVYSKVDADVPLPFMNEGAWESNHSPDEVEMTEGRENSKNSPLL